MTLTWLLSCINLWSFCVVYNSLLGRLNADAGFPSDGKLNGEASLRMGDDGWECVGVVVPEPTDQFLVANVFRAFATPELDGYGLDVLMS